MSRSLRYTPPSWPPNTYSEPLCTTADGKTREPGERDTKLTGTHGTGAELGVVES